VPFLKVVGVGLACPGREYRGDAPRMEEPIWTRTTSREPRHKAGMRGARQSRLPHVPSGEPYRGAAYRA